MKNIKGAVYKSMGLGIIIGIALFYLSYCLIGSVIFSIVVGLSICSGIIIVRLIYHKVLSKGVHK